MWAIWIKSGKRYPGKLCADARERACKSRQTGVHISRKTGHDYEEKAVKYLEEKGYLVLAQNFYSSFGEIDIIARKDSYIIFIEVKYRLTDKGGHPLEAVDEKKKKRICKTASYFCTIKRFSEETPIRFDVIGILADEIYHIENAFSYR